MKRIVFTIVLLSLAVPTMSSAQEITQDSFREFCVREALAFDFESLTEHRSIYTLTELSKSCALIGKVELAQTFLNRASDIAEKSKPNSHHFALLRCALEIGEIEQAVKIANGAGASKNRLLDQIDLERYRRGDRDALKHFPRVPLNFFAADRVAKVYIELGDIEGAEKFIKEMKVVDKENDPRAISAWALEEIAKLHRDRGDLDKAKETIDRAMAIGGKLFYTGYGIEVTKKSIYGELTDDCEAMAQKAVRYRGSHARELLQSLIAELIETQNFEEAKQVSKHLDDEEDVHTVLRRVASAQASIGKMVAVEKTIAAIKSPSAQSRARIAVAQTLWFNGKKEQAMELAEEEYKFVAANKFEASTEKQFQSLANLFGSMSREKEVTAILKKAETPLQYARVLKSAVDGFAAQHETDLK